MTPSKQLSPAELAKLVATLEELLPPLKDYVASIQEQRQQSYVQLAIAVLEELGKPTPITVLLQQIRSRRNDPSITRGAVETSLLRYLNTKGDEAPVVKVYPGTYALREHVMQQIA